MGTLLQQLLQSLCWNSEWNYAVLWKLKDHARMVLALEDSYCANQYKLVPSEIESFNNSLNSLQDGNSGKDSLDLAVAKMSCHVYSLGEGIVGQVAVTGKHKWIFSDERAMNSYSSLELYDEWQPQFAAGIKTIVVAAVVPFGVVQFGSLNKVNENLQFLALINEAFSSLQESAFYMQTSMQSNLQHMLQMVDTSSQLLTPDVLQHYLLEKAAIKDNTCSISADNPSQISKNGLSEVIGTAKFVQAVPTEMEQSTDMLDPDYKINNSRIHNTGVIDNNQIYYSSKSSTLYDSELTGDNSGALPEFNCLETSGKLNSPFMFSAGTELHEALGLTSRKQCCPFPCEVENPKDGPPSQMPESVENSMLTSDSCTDHLLEAVVANFCHNYALKSRNSFSNSDSILTTERMPEPSINTSNTIGSFSNSMGCSSIIEDSTQNWLNSSNSCRQQLTRSSELCKPNKKRARAGENSRPRPRDRQLIQDRIKELRELVPNGSKCSIDSLLERTIKHMAFMQNVTEHYDKLSNCPKSKVCSEMGVLGSGNEQGSSWAVEVGGHMKICRILVENLNINGQMLIEMLCENCDHILEITEAIRALGLTILKGITDNHGDKTWMQFVVEGQSDRNLHRMDVLWSLVQILQSKTTL